MITEALSTLSHRFFSARGREISLGYLLLGILAFAYLYLTVKYVLPYFPYPSDDMDYRNAMDGRPFSRMWITVVTIAVYRLISGVLMNQTIIHVSSVFDSMVITAAIINLATAVILFLIMRSIRGGLIWPILVALLYLSSEWTSLYLYYLSHAPITAFFFCSGLYLALKLYLHSNRKLKKQSKQGKKWLFRLYVLGYTTTISLLAFTSSSGMYWSAINVGFLIFLFTSRWYQNRNSQALAYPMRRGISMLKSNILWVLVSLLPIFVATNYFLSNISKYAYQYIENINNQHLLLASKHHGESLSNLSFSILRLINYHAPIIGLTTLILLSLIVSRTLLLTRFQKIKSLPLALSREHTISLCLMATLVAAVVIAELLPFTKLGRSFFPLTLLLYGTFVLCALLLADMLPRKNFVAGIIAIVICVEIGWSIARVFDHLSVRFDLSRFLAQYYGSSDYYAFKKDDHSVAYFLPLLTMKTRPDQPELKINLIDNVQDMRAESGRTAILVIGPRGAKSGQSTMNACMNEDFLPADNSMRRPVDSQEYRFRFSGYLEPFYLEEEVCQYLFFKGRSVAVEAPEKEVVVWVVTS